MKPIKQTAGFTLSELMVTLAVVGIIMAMAAPAFNKLIEKRRLMGAGEQIYSQLSFARNEAVKRSKPLYLTFTTSGSTTWSFGITDRTGGCTTTITDPNNVAGCSIDLDNDLVNTTTDRMLYLFDSADFSGVSLAVPTFSTIPQGCSSTNLDTNETCFDGVRGMVRNGSLRLSTDNFALDVRLDLIGRALMCSPISSGKAIPDYRCCPDDTGYPNC